MGTKKKTPITSSANLPTLTIGSRVRCTEDGVMGRIVWANATSVKITWDDGEQVTWRRDSLADRPIEILDADAASAEDPQAEPPAADGAPEQTMPEQPVVAEPPVMGSVTTAATPEEATANDIPTAGPVPSAGEQTASASPTAGSTGGKPTQTAPAKAKRQRKAPAAAKDKRLSAIDAAVKVLQEAGTAMTTQEMIDAMAAKGYWASPAGKTPAATLYSAILREITAKGEAARFAKTERGKFARKPGA
jgi:hypothetical protein